MPSDSKRIEILNRLLVCLPGSFCIDGIRVCKAKVVQYKVESWEVEIMATGQKWYGEDLASLIETAEIRLNELRDKLGGPQAERLKKLEDFAKEFKRVATIEVQLVPTWLRNLEKQADEALKP